MTTKHKALPPYNFVVTCAQTIFSVLVIWSTDSLSIFGGITVYLPACGRSSTWQLTRFWIVITGKLYLAVAFLYDIPFLTVFTASSKAFVEYFDIVGFSRQVKKDKQNIDWYLGLDNSQHLKCVLVHFISISELVSFF